MKTLNMILSLFVILPGLSAFGDDEALKAVNLQSVSVNGAPEKAVATFRVDGGAESKLAGQISFAGKLIDKLNEDYKSFYHMAAAVTDKYCDAHHVGEVATSFYFYDSTKGSVSLKLANGKPKIVGTVSVTYKPAGGTAKTASLNCDR